VFYVSREVPLKHVSLIVRACGGRIANEFSPSVTHFVVDRPSLPPGFSKEQNVEYIQPQYVFDCLNARAVLPVHGYRMGEELPPHVSPFTVAIAPSKADQEVVDQTIKEHPKIVSYIPDRVHEIRKFIDPSYNAVDPSGKLRDIVDDADASDHEIAPGVDGDDDISLSGEEVLDATKPVPWREEEVTETVKRSKLSAYKVAKQRELNVMNKPTPEVVASRRKENLKQMEKKRKEETEEQRLKRKLVEAAKQERITKKMQLQVARKKAARYYRMVNGVLEGNKKKETILAAKAKLLKEGKTQVDKVEQVVVKAKDVQRRERAAAKGKDLPKRKAANPYKKLPKWVR
jgi:pescadillo protein